MIPFLWPTPSSGETGVHTVSRGPGGLPGDRGKCRKGKASLLVFQHFAAAGRERQLTDTGLGSFPAPGAGDPMGGHGLRSCPACLLECLTNVFLASERVGGLLFCALASPPSSLKVGFGYTHTERDARPNEENKTVRLGLTIKTICVDYGKASRRPNGQKSHISSGKTQK